MDERLIPLLKYFSEDEVMTYFWQRTDEQIQYLREWLDGMDEEQVSRVKSGLKNIQRMRETERYLWMLRN